MIPEILVVDGNLSSYFVSYFGMNTNKVLFSVGFSLHIRFIILCCCVLFEGGFGVSLL